MSWPGLTRPPIFLIALRALDGRLKGGHDMWGYFFPAYGFLLLRTLNRSGVPTSPKVSRKPFCR